MNIDDVANSIPEVECALREEFSHLIDEWKRNAEPLDKLEYLVSKWHGNVWFRNIEESDKFIQNWNIFKAEAIDCIHGMTVNERLYFFGLFGL